MVSYEQLELHLSDNECFSLEAKRTYRMKKQFERQVCREDLDKFWGGECITMDQPDVEICDGNAISIFLGKCIEADGYQFCARVPEIVHHKIDQYSEDHPKEEQLPEKCFRNEHGNIWCPGDLSQMAFAHGDCFRINDRFICREDMDDIMDTMCIEIDHILVCDLELQKLFHGERITTVDGH